MLMCPAAAGLPTHKPAIGHLVRQILCVRNRIGVVADGADRTAAEPRCFGRQMRVCRASAASTNGVEETFELAVVDLVAEPLEPARITTQDQEDRSIAIHGMSATSAARRSRRARSSNPDHRGLLEIRFRGG
jgi:hypothetical protein